MTDPRNWTEGQLSEYMQRFTKGGTLKAEIDSALSVANPKPARRLKAERQNESKEVHSKYRIHVHSRRRRLADYGGISYKAAVDGLKPVKFDDVLLGGLFGDDNPDWVESITESQEKAEVEETILEVWEILNAKTE